MGEDMHRRLGSIRDFSFVDHSSYPVSDERLTAIMDLYSIEYTNCLNYIGNDVKYGFVPDFYI